MIHRGFVGEPLQLRGDALGAPLRSRSLGGFLLRAQLVSLRLEREIGRFLGLGVEPVAGGGEGRLGCFGSVHRSAELERISGSF